MGLKAPERLPDLEMFPGLVPAFSEPGFRLLDLHFRKVIVKTDFPWLHFVGVETKEAVALQ